MKLKNYALLCLVALLAVTACKKTSAPKPGPGPTGSTGTTNTVIDTDVYVLGTTTEGANAVVAYWKNGEMTELSDKSINCYAGNNIIVNGSDVYATGYYQNGSIFTPVYWKIGQTTQETPLKLPTDGVTKAFANGIAFYNNSVYVAGTIFRGTVNKAVYWIDDQLPVEKVSGSTGYAVAVNGTEVVLAGIDPSGISAYWKESDPIKPSTDGLLSSALAMVVNGSDIYTAGYTFNGNNGATYWKNGVPTYVTDGSTSAASYAIALQGQDVLTVGYAYSNNQYRAYYWINDKKSTKLDDGGATDSRAYGIALVGNNDVYICGRRTDATTGNVGVYWKNGKMKPLSLCYNTNGIAVVTHPHQ